MNIEIDNSKRMIVAYSSGEYPNITQHYIQVNYPKDDLGSFMNDVDNMMDHYCRSHKIDAIDEIDFQPDFQLQPDQKKKNIQEAIDSLLDELNKLK